MQHTLMVSGLADLASDPVICRCFNGELFRSSLSGLTPAPRLGLKGGVKGMDGVAAPETLY